MNIVKINDELSGNKHKTTYELSDNKNITTNNKIKTNRKGFEHFRNQSLIFTILTLTMCKHNANKVRTKYEQSTNKVRTSREQAVYSFGIRLVFSWYFLGAVWYWFGIGLVLTWGGLGATLRVRSVPLPLTTCKTRDRLAPIPLG